MTSHEEKPTGETDPKSGGAAGFFQGELNRQDWFISWNLQEEGASVSSKDDTNSLQLSQSSSNPTEWTWAMNGFGSHKKLFQTSG